MEQVGILYLMSARHVFKQLLCTESRHKPIRGRYARDGSTGSDNMQLFLSDSLRNEIFDVSCSVTLIIAFAASLRNGNIASYAPHGL